MALGAWFVLSLGMTADGVGLVRPDRRNLGGPASAAVLIWRSFHRMKARATWAQIWDREKSCAP